MSIIKAIDKAFVNKEKRGWDKIYYFFDIHETILIPDYGEDVPLEFYPWAKEVLQYLSKREDISISLYTCSYPQEIQKYVEFFEEHDITFEYRNKNPDVKNTTYGYYEDKPYFNVLFEDKAGFDAKIDWVRIFDYYSQKEQFYNSNFFFHCRNPKYGISPNKSLNRREVFDLIMNNM